MAQEVFEPFKKEFREARPDDRFTWELPGKGAKLSLETPPPGSRMARNGIVYMLKIEPPIIQYKKGLRQVEVEYFPPAGVNYIYEDHTEPPNLLDLAREQAAARGWDATALDQIVFQG